MKHLFLLFFSMALLFPMQAQDSTYRVKMMHYNLLKFGDCDGAGVSDKYTWLGAILNDYRPDIFTVNELFPAVNFANGIVQLSFTYSGDISYANFTNSNGGSIVNQIFYNDQLFGLKSNSILGSSNIRDINIYELYFKPSISGTDTTFLHVLVAHYKAGGSSSNQDDRWDASIDVMNWIKNKGQGKNILLAGDLNVGSASENAFQELVSSRPAGETLVDPLNLASGWGGPSFGYAMTQSTRSSSSDCGVNGGMDDRFDFILPNENVMNGSLGVTYKGGSYEAFGNDGDDFNVELDCSSNSKVSSNVCISLKLMSDHLPVVMEMDIEGFKQNTTNIGPLLSDIKARVMPRHRGFILSLEGGKLGDRYELEVKNLFGQSLIHTSHPGQGAISYDLPGNPGGIYLIRLKDERGRSLSRKIIVR